jgi:hypothetical protein
MPPLNIAPDEPKRRLSLMVERPARFNAMITRRI